MSEENVELVRRIYATFPRGVAGGVAPVSEPVEEWTSLIDPGIEWRGPREFPDLAEPVFGRLGVRNSRSQGAEFTYSAVGSVRTRSTSAVSQYSRTSVMYPSSTRNT